MCLLIAKPANVPFPKEWVEMCKNAADTNDDGMGYGTVGGLMYKTITDKPDVFAEKCIQNIPTEHPAIIHFRFSTGGRINPQNCHPFMISDGTIFAHNGIISTAFPPTVEDSDTAVLAKSAANIEELHFACEYLVNNGSNKFASISPGGQLTIIGESHGSWDQGLWWSNCGYKRSSYRVAGFSSVSHFTDDDIPTVTDLFDLEDEVMEMCLRVGRWNVEKIVDLCTRHDPVTVREMIRVSARRA